MVLQGEVEWVGVHALLCSVYISRSHATVTWLQSHHTSGQPLLVSDAVTVADMSSAVGGLSRTVTLVIVTSFIIVIVHLVLIIVLCQCQGTYSDNDYDALNRCHQIVSLFHIPCMQLYIEGRTLSPRRMIIKWRTSKKSNWNHPAYEAVTTTWSVTDNQTDYFYYTTYLNVLVIG